MIRSDFSKQSKAAWLVFCITAAAALPVTALDARTSEKKGLAMATRNADAWDKMEALDVSWFYNWTAGHPSGKPEQIEFIPMVWGLRGDTEWACEKLAADAASGRHTTVLGFNEPDGKKQANLSVAKALKAWPMLESTNLRLGSPATVHPDNEWMVEFMEEAEDRDLRVDFICVHWYGGPNVNGFVRRLKEIHELYDRPIWITEFAVGDWNASSVEEARYSVDEIAEFLEDLLEELDDLDFVERYAWFATSPDHRALGNSALFDAEGNLTKVGEVYRDH